jgi:CRP-like cAMP-binding protein
VSRLNIVQLLAGLPAAELADLERRCRWQRYAADERILDRDSESREVFFVAEGRVQIVNFSAAGRKVALATLRAGDYFGELSAIDGEPRSASVVALEDSRLAALAPEDFLDLLERRPKIAVTVLKRLARIIRVSDDRIMDLTTVPAPQRVHRELMRLAEPDAVAPGTWVIHPMPTHDAIAGRASTTRETASRVLSQLSGAGVIERKAKTLFIRDLERLAELAQQPATAR